MVERTSVTVRVEPLAERHVVEPLPLGEVSDHRRLAGLLAVAGVALTRFLPFLVFRPGRPTPPFVAYLGKWLGPAVFGLLVVYCLREPLTTGARLVPALVCTAVTVELQLWKRQMMLSMAVGTGLYMLLIRLPALP